MRFVRVLLGVAFLVAIVCAYPALGQEAKLSDLKLKAVKSLEVVPQPGDYQADLRIQMRNASPKTIRLKTVNFKVTFKGEEKSVFLGDGVIKNEDIVPTPGEHESASLDLRLTLGPRDDKTTERMAEFINLWGNPSKPLTMLLELDGEVGVSVDQGWVYYKGVGAELSLQPEIKRELLFK